jgi:hypothetical protein
MFSVQVLREAVVHYDINAQILLSELELYLGSFYEHHIWETSKKSWNDQNC